MASVPTGTELVLGFLILSSLPFTLITAPFQGLF